jgi:hypothetical protein
MGGRTLRMLIAAAIAMAALLYVAQIDFDQTVSEALLPDLKAGLNDVEKITITAGGGRVVATLERGETQWTLAERSGYAADVGKIRRNLIALADAKIVEKKTSNPEFYERLGVQDISDPDAGGVLLEFQSSGQAAAGPERLIIGETGVRGDMAYIRRTGQTQSFLVSADLDVSTKTIDWLARNTVDIAARDVRAVTISHPDGETLRIEKSAPEEAEFAVLGIPEGRALAYATIANQIGGTLASLQLDDVVPAAEVDRSGLEPVVTRFETFDGLVLEVRTYTIDSDLKIEFRAIADEPRARELNEKLSPWLYTIPSYKSEQLVKRMDDLLESTD